MVFDVTEDGWLDAMDEWVTQQAGRRLWEQVKQRDNENSICADLDMLAERIEAAVPTAAAAVVRSLGADPLIQNFVTVLLEETETSLTTPLAELARRIRMIGVYLCSITGRITTCPCLRSLAEPMTEDALKAVLTAATSSVR